MGVTGLGFRELRLGPRPVLVVLHQGLSIIAGILGGHYGWEPNPRRGALRVCEGFSKLGSLYDILVGKP